ncbi:MAG: diadenosine tetraphosphate hydrolase [candidate division SR1 bacterium]|nr:MAG: diadenosine tetraphosphate hydrolase [candidate division SR1 bacterium]
MMQKADCLFCKILAGEIPSHKVWENEEFYAFLDLFPNCKGQTLVIPKDHYDSDLFKVEESAFYGRYLLAVREVVQLLKSKLGIERVGMIMEGMGVDHLHIKLYPMWGLEKERKAIEADERVYFEQYEGYLTTKMGTMATQDELQQLSEQLKGV